VNFRALWIATLCLALCGRASAEQSVSVRLTRLPCGDEPAPIDVRAFSDTYAYTGTKLAFTYSCYLIQHGADYMLWDTGNPPGASPTSPKKSIRELLSELNVGPEKIKYVGISHYHDDHTGQLADFPQATLLIGKGDWDALTATQAPSGMDANAAAAWRAPFAHWLGQGGKRLTPVGDKDVFGDGTVVMLSTPGHTPGHHSLLLRLRMSGNVLLTGDLAHIRENYDNNQVPTWNTSRTDTLASLDRFKQIARNLRATVIIQHDPRDIDKLPPFPGAAD
jgi:N-acyl homoserine lactone hydrolase